jgi:hypothetical protein
MTWSKIVGVLKRLDSRLSDAVYLHGCYLTGQEKIVRHHPQDEGKDLSQESSNASGIHAPINCGSTDGDRSIAECPSEKRLNLMNHL